MQLGWQSHSCPGEGQDNSGDSQNALEITFAYCSLFSHYLSTTFFGSRFLLSPGNQTFHEAIWDTKSNCFSMDFLSGPARLDILWAITRARTGLPRCVCFPFKSGLTASVMRVFSKRKGRYCKRLQTSTWHLNSYKPWVINLTFLAMFKILTGVELNLLETKLYTLT